MWDKLFASADLIQQGLEASWLRNTVIRNNIANVETPNFKASSVEFEEHFASALYSAGITGKKTREKHRDIGGAKELSEVEARVVEDTTTSMRMDGNNVDIESENVKLAQNSIQYNLLISKLNSELGRLKLAITEGR